MMNTRLIRIESRINALEAANVKLLQELEELKQKVAPDDRRQRVSKHSGSTKGR